MTTRTYAPPSLSDGIDLDLSKNEGPATALDPSPTIGRIEDLVRRYPDTAALRERLAALNGVPSERVLVTAGGDDALFRCFLARLGPGRTAIATRPTFEMIPIYAAQVGSRLVEINWMDGPFPTRVVASAATGTDVAFIVSPNNPTGAVVTADDLRTVAAAARLVVLDAAYTEFADIDLTPAALDLGNVVVVRTLSKGYGLAGLRVGYLLGPPGLIREIGSRGCPYPVASLSSAVATARLDDPGAVRLVVDEIRSERERFVSTLAGLGARALPSQGNFVLVDVPDAERVTAGLAGLGIGVRRFPDRPGLERAIRITMPGDPGDFARLERAITTVLSQLSETRGRTHDLEEVLP